MDKTIITRASAGAIALSGLIWTWGSRTDPKEVLLCASVAVGFALVALLPTRRFGLVLGTLFGSVGPTLWLADAAAASAWTSEWLLVGVGADIVAIVTFGVAFGLWRGSALARAGFSVIALAGAAALLRDASPTLWTLANATLLAGGAGLSFAPPIATRVQGGP